MPDGVIVRVDRRHRRPTRERISPRIEIRTLEGVPTVIGALLTDVDLFPMVLADIGNVEGAQRAVEAVPPRIAQAECEDLVGAGRPDEGIVGRYRIVLCRIARKSVAVHVKTQDVAEQVVDVLSGVKGIAAAAAVTQRGVEIAVGSEPEPARLVVARGRLWDGDDRRGARRVRNVWTRRYVITADLGVTAGVDQI